ncbi:MAG: hypothetical protein WA726_10865, partial [Acidimicrobiia bacterium]
HRLAALLSAFPVLTILVGEYSPDAVAGLPEFAVADAIFSLELEASDHREKRVLQVIRLRGVTSNPDVMRTASPVPACRSSHGWRIRSVSTPKSSPRTG